MGMLMGVNIQSPDSAGFGGADSAAAPKKAEKAPEPEVELTPEQKVSPPCVARPAWLALRGSPCVAHPAWLALRESPYFDRSA